TPLKVCGRDAGSFARFLYDKMQFPAASIRVMTDTATDPNQQPSYTKLKSAIRTFLAGIGPESEVVFFFSGHGARSGNQDWLLPLDGEPEDLPSTGISYTALRSELEGKQPRRCLIVTDACRNLLAGKAAGGSGFGADEMLKSPQFAELR